MERRKARDKNQREKEKWLWSGRRADRGDEEFRDRSQEEEHRGKEQRKRSEKSYWLDFQSGRHLCNSIYFLLIAVSCLQSSRKVHAQVLETGIDEASLYTDCLHKNVNIIIISISYKTIYVL